MTPTIQCYDDQSMQIPPAASVLCNDLFFQEYHQTSASDRINSNPDVRLNHQWNQYLRNRHLTFRGKRNPPSFASAFKANVKKLLDGQSPEELVSEEHLNIIRKRQSLLLITIQTMVLFHHNQILENKMSALHKRIVRQIQKERQTNDVSTSE